MSEPACPLGFVELTRAATLVAVTMLACSNGDGQRPTAQQAGGAGEAGTVGAGAGGLGSGGTTAGASVGGAGSGVGGASMGGTRAGMSGMGGGSANAGASGAGGSSGASAGAEAGGVSGASGKGGSGGADAGSGGKMVDPPTAGQSGSGSMPMTGTPTLFWLDVSGKVLRSDVAKFAVKTLVPSAGQGSDGIAVNLDAGYIYWTNMGSPAADDGSVMRSNLDGTGVKTLVPAGGTYTPKQLKLVREEQRLYWSDREGMRVMRSKVDGTGIETLYTPASGAQARMDAANWCVGIAVDPVGGYFYWSQKGPDNGHEGTLKRAHLAMPAGENDVSRSDVETLYAGLPEPVDIELDLAAGLIYWTDRGDDTINRGPIEVPAGKTAATRTDREIIVEDVPEAIGVALDHERGLVYYTDAVGDLGRAGLDGSNAEFLLENGGAFTGIVALDLPP